MSLSVTPLVYQHQLNCNTIEFHFARVAVQLDVCTLNSNYHHTTHARTTGSTMVAALNFYITVDDLATEIQKHHHDSDLLRMLFDDLRDRRVDLNVFCRRP